jgi:CHAT domain-containing protein/uncharacterized protein HemY
VKPITTVKICYTDRARWLDLFCAVVRLPVSRLLLPLVLLTTFVSFNPSVRLSSARLALAPTESAVGSTKYQSLEIGKWFEREISPGETYYYTIHAAADQYFSIEVEHWGLELAGTISSPGHQKNAEFHCRRDEPTPVAVIAVTKGDYVLALQAAAGGAKVGRYQVRLKELRPTRGSDANRVIALRLLADADQLRVMQKDDSSRKAIDKYQQALASLRAVGDHELEADALKNLGRTYEELNEDKNAVAYYRQALALSQRTKDLRIQTDVVNCLSYLDFSLGNNRQALSGAESAVGLNRQARSRSAEALSLFTVGEAHYGLGDLQKAIDYYRRALTVRRELNDYRGQAQILLSIGYASSSLSHTADARAAYLEAVSLSRVAQDRRAEAKSLRALALFQTRMGEYQHALDNFQQALQILALVDDRLTKATVLAGMGFTYENLGELKKALDHDNQAIALFQEIKNPWGEAELQMDSGRVNFSLGDGKEALVRYEKALTLFRAHVITRLQAQTLRDMGAVYDSWNNRAEALNCYNQSLRLTRPGQDQRYEAYTLNYIGRVFERSGEKATAVEYYHRALGLNRIAEDPAGEALTRFNLAHVQRDLNKLDESLAQIEASLKISETLRTKVASQDIRASYVASTHRYFELHADILMQLYRSRGTESFAVAAFEASEKARARSLLELLEEAHADIREGVDTALLDQERTLGRELNAKAERHAELLLSGKRDEAQAVAREVDQLSSDYEKTETEIRSTSPHYAALTQPQPLNLKEIQQQILDNDSLLLEYMLGDERSYVWAVTRTGISAHELPARAEIDRAAREYYDSLTSPRPALAGTFEQRQARVRQDEAQLASQTAALSALLLKPVVEKLGAKRLLIVADGALQYIPFQALTMPVKTSVGDSESNGRIEDQRWLVLDHEIINEPSASTLALVLSENANRSPALKSVAILADPVFEMDDSRIKLPRAGSLVAVAPSPSDAVTPTARDVGQGADGEQIPRLPASREEAEAIMGVLPWRTGFMAVGFEANRAIVMGSGLAQYRVVHFATHAFLDNERPALSGIVLSLVDEKGQRQDGFLRLHDIYNLKLPVDLVVLSACQTGLGKDVKGEGLIGLTRGFMYAGASGVVASLWKVDDDATAELMKHFYEGMFQRGLSPSAALREAQLALRGQKRWHEPYYWAGFVIQGQYTSKNSMKPSRAVEWVAALGSFGTALTLGIVFILRRRRRRNL